MDHEIKMMLNAILEEIGQIDERANKRLDKIESKLDSLQHEVNARKLERESIGLLIKNSRIFSPLQADFRSVEKLKNAGKPHKHYVFVRSRRSFYTLFLWCFFGEWCPNGAQIPRGDIKGYKSSKEICPLKL